MTGVGYRPFRYRGLNGFEGLCDVAIVEKGDGITVVFRERDDNPGPSVTNAAEMLATTLWRRELHARAGEGTIRFYETYDDATYDEILFGVAPAGRGGFYAFPSWRRVTSWTS